MQSANDVASISSNVISIVEQYLQAKQYFLTGLFVEAKTSCDNAFELLKQSALKKTIKKSFSYETHKEYVSYAENYFSQAQFHFLNEKNNKISEELLQSSMMILAEMYALRADIFAKSEKYDEAINYYDLAINVAWHRLQKISHDKSREYEVIKTRIFSFEYSKSEIYLLLGKNHEAALLFRQMLNFYNNPSQRQKISQQFINLYIKYAKSTNDTGGIISQYWCAIQLIDEQNSSAYTELYDSCVKAIYTRINQFKHKLPIKENEQLDGIFDYDGVISLSSKTTKKLSNKEIAELYYEKAQFIFNSELGLPSYVVDRNERKSFYLSYEACSNAINLNNAEEKYFIMRADIYMHIARGANDNLAHNDKVMKSFVHSFYLFNQIFEKNLQASRQLVNNLSLDDKVIVNNTRKEIQLILFQKAFSDYLQALQLNPDSLKDNKQFQTLLSTITHENLLSIISCYPKNEQILLLESCINEKNPLGWYINSKSIFYKYSAIYWIQKQISTIKASLEPDKADTKVKYYPNSENAHHLYFIATKFNGDIIPETEKKFEINANDWKARSNKNFNNDLLNNDYKPISMKKN